MLITGYYAYRIFLTIKSHFNNKNYNLSDYEFNYIKPKYETFLKSNTIFYDILAKKSKTEKELVNILICAFMKNPTIWIKDIIDDYTYYRDLKNSWESKINNFPYLFKHDIAFLLENGMSFDISIGSFVFDKLISHKIELETFIILKGIFNFCLDNDDNYKYLYPNKYVKYECILQFDLNKYKKMLEEIIKCNIKTIE